MAMDCTPIRCHQPNGTDPPVGVARRHIYPLEAGQVVGAYISGAIVFGLWRLHVTSVDFMQGRCAFV